MFRRRLDTFHISIHNMPEESVDEIVTVAKNDIVILCNESQYLSTY